MQEVTNVVKSKGVEVGKAVHPKYDTTAEAVAAQGEATILEILNAQIRTNAMNAVRAEATGTPSGKVLQQKAFKELIATRSPEELAALVADDVQMNEAMNVIVARMKDEAAQGVAQASAEAPAEAEEEEELEDID